MKFSRSSYLDNSCGCSLYGHCDSRICDILGLQVPTPSGSLRTARAPDQQRQRCRVWRRGSSDVDRLRRCIHSAVNNFWIHFFGIDDFLCILLRSLFLAANSQILLVLNNKHFPKWFYFLKLCWQNCLQV